jgi:hypothetical protein
LALSDSPRKKDRLATTTHAKLRASQGDVATARRILESILAARPDDGEARALLGRLEHAAGTGHSEPGTDAHESPQPSTAADLRARFRKTLSGARGSAGGLKGRLEALLSRIDDIRRHDRAR